MLTLYLAGKISGLSYYDAVDWRDHVERQLMEYPVVCFSPLRGNSSLSKETVIEPDTIPQNTTSQELYERDIADIKRADIVLAYLPHLDSFGTAFELGQAKALDKFSILVVKGKNQFHPYAQHGTARQTNSLEQAIEAIQSLSETITPDFGGS